MNRLIAVFATILSLFLSPSSAAADRPNVLIVMADDCTFNDLPVYGGKNAKTPNIDRLASEGLVFNHAYLAEAMCQPCRAELYTGQYPMRNGCAWNHSASLPDTKSMPQHLGKLGYRVGIAGKVHVSPKKAFPFEPVAGFEPGCVRDPTRPHDLVAAKDFITRSSRQPFCLVIALVEPHVPWVMGDASAYPPKKITLPPNIADNAATREVFSRYLAEITYMDSQVGDILSMLEESGRSDDTLVLFTTEQGSQFPGNKWTNWDTGVHTALIARWPGKVPSGRRTDALIQYADVLPTLLDLAGLDAASAELALDGTSFRAVLMGESKTHRKYVYGIHNNIPEGPSYPIRTISNGNYRYVRNLSPENLYIEKHVMAHQNRAQPSRTYWQTWVWDAVSSDETYRLVQRYQRRPKESLYHTESDPYEMQDLAANGSQATSMMMKELASELDRWMDSQGDPGLPQDTREAHQAAKRGQHLYRAPSQE